MIVLLDFGVGNLLSMASGLQRGGAETAIVPDGAGFAALQSGGPVEGVVLPGVGSFGDAMFQLRARQLLPVIKQVVRSRTPLLGVCLGMQLLFGWSEEHGRHIGLGLLPGQILRFRWSGKVPHMGWNDLSMVAEHPLLNGVKRGDEVYFVHSYYAVLHDESNKLGACTYNGVDVPAVVGRGCIFGTQFHPEKSGAVGERILRNFIAICRRQATSNGALTGGGKLYVN